MGYPEIAVGQPEKVNVFIVGKALSPVVNPYLVKAFAVKPLYPAAGTYPHKAITVLDNIGHMALKQPFVDLVGNAVEPQQGLRTGDISC